MDEKLWDECIRFHGHSCPGLAMGFRASEVAAEELGIPLEKVRDEEIVCVVENDSCGVDAVQVIFSCTAGKGNLLFRITGKQAYSFFDRRSGRKVRVLIDGEFGDMDRGEFMEHVLTAPREEVLKIKVPEFEVPETAKIFNNVRCESCGELVREDKIRLQDGKQVCLDCFKDYSRSYF
jgi:formylmethanofuran dehydrogenase subunit E